MEFGLLVHAFASIFDSYGQPRCSCRDRPRLIAGLDEKLSAVGHCVPGIHGNVEDDLLEVGLIDQNAAMRTQIDLDLDIFTDEPRQDSGQFIKLLIGIEKNIAVGLLAAEGEQLLGKSAATLGRFNDFSAITCKPIVVSKFGFQEFGVSADDAQQVVEI